MLLSLIVGSALGISACGEDSRVVELEEEVAFLKEQKRFALSGWNKEERRTQALRSQLSFLRSDLEAIRSQRDELEQALDGLVAPPPIDGAFSTCHPAYSSQCLDPGIDYDCANNPWADDGPGLVFEPIELTEVGIDPYGLDGDVNGLGCEGF